MQSQECAAARAVLVTRWGIPRAMARLVTKTARAIRLRGLQRGARPAQERPAGAPQAAGKVLVTKWGIPRVMARMVTKTAAQARGARRGARLRGR